MSAYVFVARCVGVLRVQLTMFVFFIICVCIIFLPGVQNVAIMSILKKDFIDLRKRGR